MAAALAVILAIFAAIAAPDWFARDKAGLTSPALPEDLLGLLTLIVVPVQLVLVAVAMIGFNQEWHVEEERPIGGSPLAGEGGDRSGPGTGAGARLSPQPVRRGRPAPRAARSAAARPRARR